MCAVAPGRHRALLTALVPPLGEFTMRTRFRDFPGRWVYHCHILLHEDHGMMGTVKALA